ncbi:MAG TPA: tRNA lysidine(34) synthetase TilS [Jatrophihabitans sp.]|nr:tRNA lysidine(34) synthetase TilS [Jatrophihabitans sp.]
MGPHPAVAALRLAVRQALSGQPAERIAYVACSGGADSTALAAALAFEASRTGRAAGLVTVDHGLQAGSGEQAARVAALGYELGLSPVVRVAVTVDGAGGPEAAARTARYGALGRFAAAGLVLLGHTADDQAETVLLGLGRGSGPRSIAGMRPVDGGYLRPLLGLRRADTEAACRVLGLDYWDDPHNIDPGYRRVRLRREVLPLLEEVLAGGVTEALARTATLLQQDLDALQALAEQLLTRAHRSDGLLLAELHGQPVAVLSRVVKGWAEAAGVTGLTADHVGRLTALVTDWHGQRGVDLPGGYRARRASGRLVLVRT